MRTCYGKNIIWELKRQRVKERILKFHDDRTNRTKTPSSTFSLRECVLLRWMRRDSNKCARMKRKKKKKKIHLKYCVFVYIIFGSFFKLFLFLYLSLSLPHNISWFYFFGFFSRKIICQQSPIILFGFVCSILF